LITINNLTKSFCDKLLFENASIQINKREKVGLIGSNGSGKTTLLKIITGEEHSDDGKVTTPAGYKIGFIKQHIDFLHQTVIDEASSALPGDSAESVWYAEKILSGLGFNADQIASPPILLSGGYQVRLNLAKLLLSAPDMLLLDEPTNYLDITTLRWLYNFLRNWEGELILITHDRNFMDKIITDTMIIHRQKIRKMKGTTDKIYEQITKEEEIYEQQIINDEKRRGEVEKFINRFRSKANLAKQVQSRIKMLDKQGTKEKLEKIKTLDFEFTYKHVNSQVLYEINDISFGYQNDNLLFRNLTFEIKKNDRIAIIGPNGKGKSTLLKVLSNHLRPLNGVVLPKPACTTGYFGQTNIQTLNPELTIEDEIGLSNNQLNKTQIRNICGGFLFEQEEALKKISVLSGGEKSRVSLAKITATSCNLLLLDEPTNHLDIDSTDSLLSALDSFEGAQVLVTHNELFLETLAEKLIVFDTNGVKIYDFDYKTFLEKVGWQNEKNDENNKIPADQIKNDSKKENRRERALIIEQKNRELKPVKQIIEALEKRINLDELKKNKIEQEIIDLSTGNNGDKIVILSKELAVVEKELDALYNDLFVQNDILETILIKYTGV